MEATTEQRNMRTGWETIVFFKAIERRLKKRIEILAQITIKKFTRQNWKVKDILDVCDTM